MSARQRRTAGPVRSVVPAGTGAAAAAAITPISTTATKTAGSTIDSLRAGGAVLGPGAAATAGITTLVSNEPVPVSARTATVAGSRAGSGKVSR